MGNKIFESAVRDEAHRKLEEVLSAHPQAHCREMGDRYTVWDAAPGGEEVAFRRMLDESLRQLQVSIRGVIQELAKNSPGLQRLPSGLDKARAKVDALVSSLAYCFPEEVRPVGPVVPENLLPWLKCAVALDRRRVATELEGARQRIHSDETLELLDERLKPHREVMDEPWFKATVSAKRPHLADYLTIERVEQLMSAGLSQRQYDEKFHILQAPDLLFRDLDHFRTACGARGVGLVLAFMDIDDLKSFNTKFGEDVVDLRVLPRFMRALEAHFYARGFVYRFGGNEYAALLPNADSNAAESIFDTLKERMQRVEYPVIERKPTLSIGFVEILDDSPHTNRELLSQAVTAKKEAKSRGRDRAVPYVEQS